MLEMDGCDVLVADATRSALAEAPDDLVYVDEFEIRGHQTRFVDPVKVVR